ncbi:hypothetical protein KAF25_002316 [Fusarium avenaceum]|uniref:F-box domain-containing protein n=1 Tax=Fusarium avenaceum TaxID=40199 RepID=A0A9P7H7J9_9HYPO|nr:hypothetical protein KAF25_002316 [Fusarium avenaceum]
MTSPTLNQLPPEIILDISDCLTSVDIKSLSLVDKTIRQHMVPQLFKHVKVHCPLPRDHVLRSVVAKYGTYVSSLSLQVTFYPNPPNLSYDGTKVNATCAKEGWYWNAYPQSVWARNVDDVPAMYDIIQFKGLPNCTSLTVSADGEDDFASPGEWTESRSRDTSFYLFAEPETYDQVRRAEGKYAWRQAHAEMWRDIARHSQVERLELTNFLPYKASSWLEPEWAEFLGRLKELSVQSYGRVIRDSWLPYVAPGYNAFYREIPTFLFAHAKRLECLQIASHESGFLGANALQFVPHTLPRLRTLRLRDVYITESLEEFLGEHSPSLESLCIDNCVAVGCDAYSPGTPSDPNWGGFWKAVRKGSPVLREFICEHIDNRELGGEGIADEDDSLFVWPYVDMEDPYDSASDCLEVNEEELALANDNQEYRLLMEELARRQQSSLHQSLP